jgi:nicotinic acetylcholine receptor
MIVTFPYLFLPAGLGSEDEVRLVQDLFDKQGYNPLIRPVRNLSEIIHVEFGLAMVQLINVVSYP